MFQINLEYFRDMTALGLCGMQLTDISCIAMCKSNILTSDLSDDNSNYLTLTVSWSVKNLCKNVNQIPVILVQNNLISSIIREARILLNLRIILKFTLCHWPEHLRPSAGRYILLNLGMWKSLNICYCVKTCLYYIRMHMWCIYILHTFWLSGLLSK